MATFAIKKDIPFGTHSPLAEKRNASEYGSWRKDQCGENAKPCGMNRSANQLAQPIGPTPKKTKNMKRELMPEQNRKEPVSTLSK